MTNGGPFAIRRPSSLLPLKRSGSLLPIEIGPKTNLKRFLPAASRLLVGLGKLKHSDSYNTACMKRQPIFPVSAESLERLDAHQQFAWLGCLR